MILKRVQFMEELQQNYMIRVLIMYSSFFILFHQITINIKFIFIFKVIIIIIIIKFILIAVIIRLVYYFPNYKYLQVISLFVVASFEYQELVISYFQKQVFFIFQILHYLVDIGRIYYAHVQQITLYRMNLIIIFNLILVTINLLGVI